MYLLLVITGGAAGAFGAFTYSTIQIRKKANQTASVLMSEKQIRAAGGVDKELKQHAIRLVDNGTVDLRRAAKRKDG